MARNLVLRGAAVLVGLALLPAVVIGLFFVLWGALAIDPPDPFAPDGDPCCGVPDSWHEVYAGVGLTLGLALVVGLLICAAIVAVRWGVTGRLLRSRWLAVLPAGLLAATTVSVAANLIPILDEGRRGPDCAGFTFRAARWHRADFRVRQNTALGIDHCHVLDAKRPAEVRALLGPPLLIERATRRYAISPSPLTKITSKTRARDSPSRATP